MWKDWKTEKPVDDGFYFFYGFPFQTMCKESEKRQLRVVTVKVRGSVGREPRPIYYMDGSFIDEMFLMEGVWQRIESPVLPD